MVQLSSVEPSISRLQSDSRLTQRRLPITTILVMYQLKRFQRYRVKRVEILTSSIIEESSIETLTKILIYSNRHRPCVIILFINNNDNNTTVMLKNCSGVESMVYVLWSSNILRLIFHDFNFQCNVIVPFVIRNSTSGVRL